MQTIIEWIVTEAIEICILLTLIYHEYYERKDRK